MATNETVRVYVMKLITTMSDEYTSLKLVEDEGASFDVPVDWHGDNYPSYIPLDVQIASVYSYSDYNSVEYSDVESGKLQIQFSEMGSGTESNLDTEAATIRTVMIRDYLGFLSIKQSTITIYWSDGYNYFIVKTQDMSEQTTIAIAEGVRKIK